MLLYHPVEDSNHCCYRIIRLLIAVEGFSLPMVALLISDFYSLFPGQLKYISGWPRLNSTSWKKLHALPNEYEEMLNPQRVFFQLNSVQAAAISHLHAKGLVVISSGGERAVTLIRDAMPLELSRALERDLSRSSDWFDLIATDLCRVEVSGKNGLKRKTGLMEFVYD